MVRSFILSLVNVKCLDAEFHFDVLENVFREIKDSLITLKKEEQEYRRWQLIDTGTCIGSALMEQRTCQFHQETRIIVILSSVSL